MISKNDAIKLAKAVVISLKEEEAHPNLQGRNNKARYAARGVAIRTLDNIWYEVLPNKTKEMFGWDKVNFLRGRRMESRGLTLTLIFLLVIAYTAVEFYLRSKDMKSYVVLFNEAGYPEEVLTFTCQAESAEHAQEQCEDAYPSCHVVWVHEGTKMTEAYYTYWETSHQKKGE